MKIKTIALSILTLVTIALMASCTSSKEPGDGPNPEPDPGKGEENGTEVMVQFTVRLPAHAKPEAPSTYAIEGKEEDHVKTIEVLLFNADDEYTGKPYYCSVISDDGATGITNKKKFRIGLPIGGPYTVVILSNSKDIVDAKLKDKPALKSSSKSDILALLEKEQTGKWNTTSDTDFDPIPMWGEIADVTVKKNVSLNARLTRMVSRVDIELATGARSLFKLKKVHLYNRYTKGMIAPYELSWNGAKASDPSIPAGAITNPTPQVYSVANNESLKGEIYAFEAPVEANDQKSTCLILEGEYNGTTTFYRVDFANKDGDVLSFLPLLRNHSYNITISKIKGLGAGSAEEAFKQGTANAGGLDYDIIVIDDSDITTIIYNGKYMLGFSQDEFTLSNPERTSADTDNILMVMTNVPTGWKIGQISYDVVGGEDWLSVPANQKEGDGSKTSISLLLTENKGAVDRVGYLHFSAGSLRHKVKVTQKFSDKSLSVDKSLFDDTEGFGIGDRIGYSTIDPLFNIKSNTSWTIVSSDPAVLSVDKSSGTGDMEIRVILQPSPLYEPNDDYTLTITGDYVYEPPIIITVKQFGMDIYADNDKGTANRAMSDANFLTACKTHVLNFDGGDNKLSIAEAMSVTLKLDLGSMSITSLKGIEYFRAMSTLDCNNNQLTALDISKNLRLKFLYCSNNQLSKLELAEKMAYSIIDCSNNQFSELDLTKIRSVRNLNCSNNQLTSLDMTEKINLRNLNCSNNQLTELDMTEHERVDFLDCSNNQLTLLKFEFYHPSIYLTELYCSNNQLTELDVTQAVRLGKLHCQDNLLLELHIRSDAAQSTLTELFCQNNQLPSLGSNHFMRLTVLDCSNNQLTTLGVGSREYLNTLRCSDNQLTTINARENVKLTDLECGNNPLLTTLDLSGSPLLTHVSAIPSNIATVYVWWTGGLAGKPTNWNFPAGVTYTYKP